ncbi:phosphatase PAP2 family protein [Saccharomonospora piscinae]|uniref:phosphatase PAP2 family protein n=1 Tax=Saccharomonospora piscinae TaxID=687388 RepID=UPI0011063588|nr:phosphatase PAP2 family protein [Saccharomonospora piscinae]TLW91325.1 phosphatase PAP2 family protein [Saccharomonospora piscinae]
MPLSATGTTPTVATLDTTAPGGQAEQVTGAAMGVPDISTDLYRTVLDAAGAAPGWLQGFAVFFTEAGVVLLGLLMVAGWWQARRGSARAMGLSLLTSAAVVAAYATSEVAKLIIEQERPCSAVPGAVPIASCPELGDWSFPSNHSTIAGAAAMAVFVCRRGALGAVALVLGALVAFSRVVVGVHYPHDVAAGFFLGLLVVGVASALGVHRVTLFVQRFRPHPLLGPGVARPTVADSAPDTDGEVTTVLSAVPAADTAPTRPLPPAPHWPPESLDDQRGQG